MTQAQTPTTTPNDLLRLAAKHPVRWLAPALLATMAAAGYAMFRPPVWEASQALTVRDEASAAAPDHLGKFHFVDDMKTVQETLLELTKSRGLLAAALKQLGPPSDSAAAWPTDADVTALQGGVKLSPPKGAEFGKTEVFYLQVQSTDRQRAVLLAAAVSDQLKQRFDDLRDARAQSLINELSKTVTLAQADLKLAAVRLATIDAEAGPDLGELRTLADGLAGESPLRRSLSEMETELRGARTAQEANAALLKLLETSKDDPAFLASAPAKLLESQPALKKLKDALTDAQLTMARLLGSLDEAHPSVQAARTAEAEITEHAHEEIAAAIRGVTIDQRLAGDRCATLERQLAEAKTRLNKLAAMRTDYASLAAEVHRRTDILKAAESQLSEARAIEAGAHTASLITGIDKPEAGPNPISAGRTVIVLGGAVGGLLLGFGLLLLTSQGSVGVIRRDRRAGDATIAEPLLPAILVAGPVTPPVQPARTPVFTPIEPSHTAGNAAATAPSGPMSLKQALRKVESAAW